MPSLSRYSRNSSPSSACAPAPPPMIASAVVLIQRRVGALEEQLVGDRQGGVGDHDGFLIDRPAEAAGCAGRSSAASSRRAAPRGMIGQQRRGQQQDGHRLMRGREADRHDIAAASRRQGCIARRRPRRSASSAARSDAARAGAQSEHGRIQRGSRGQRRQQPMIELHRRDVLGQVAPQRIEPCIAGRERASRPSAGTYCSQARMQPGDEAAGHDGQRDQREHDPGQRTAAPVRAPARMPAIAAARPERQRRPQHGAAYSSSARARWITSR